MNSSKEKELLKEALKKYKTVINKEKYDYLNSLIELEYSIIVDYISEEEKLVLSELDIYKLIANYNINKRAIKLIEQEKEQFNINIKNNDYDNLSIYADIDRSSIILFNYNSVELNNENNTGMVVISLYKTIDSIEQREKEIKRIESILDVLYTEKNPYPHIDNVYGGPSSNWSIKHNNDINQYEFKLKKIKEKVELTEKEKQEIEITNKINKLLLEEYGLKESDFVDNQLYNKTKDKTEMYKIRIKQLANFNIKNNIKYI